jgi:hypothetical protein
MSAAIRRPGAISPRFQRAITSTSGPSSQSAERALANQRRRAHARHEATAMAVGAPQRAQRGGASARSL